MNTTEKGEIAENLAVKILTGSSLNQNKYNKLGYYDIIWNEKKIEVKMSSTYPYWVFHADKVRKDIDYYLLIGYKNNIPYKLFLIPYKEVHTNYSIKLSAEGSKRGKQSKYRKYEIKVKKNILIKFRIF
jgi:hypothetical protein